MTQIIINETTPVVVEVSTPGPQGSSGTAIVGTVTTGASGSAAAVTNSGTPSAAVFNFTIPKGDIGDVTPAATAAKNAAEAAAIAAAASEIAAETAEQAAEDSATAALASANQASASASTAGTKAQEATDSASTAYSAAIAANLSRNVASAASTNANNKAAAALASADTASTKAQEASASEVVASTKAQEAVVSATTATNKASEANASAATALSAQQVTTDNATLAIAQANIASAKAAAANTSANDALVQASVATAQAAEATTQATTATTQAGIATTQATTATTQAGIASTQANTAIAQAAIATTKASEASVSASNSQGSALAALASQTASAASAAAANTSAGNASGSAASALAIYGTTAAQQAALTNAQSAASLAQGYALSAASAIQQDLSGVTAQALHRSPNAVTAMFVYDTSKDSDGGAWTEKCQHTSWYNEALNGKWLGAHVNELNARSVGATLGPDKITNGSFSTASGFGITAGAINTSTGRFEFNGVATGNLFYQDGPANSYLATSFYLVEFDYSSNVPLSSYIGGGSIQTANSGTGRFRGVVQGTAGIRLQINVGGTSATGWIDNLSVREVTALTTASGDYYQSTADGKFYRLWKNLLNFPEQLNNAAWSKVGTAPTITDNHATGPNGRPATRLQFTANGIGNRVQQVFAEAGGVRTISFLMKGEAGGESMQVGDGWTASSVITLTTSWQKVSLTLNASNPSTGVYLYAASGTPTVQVSEIQHEYGTVATTFEPKTNEGTRTETFRGNKADFPRLAGIVAETGNLTIYDLTEAGRPMWMRFIGTTANGGILGGYGYAFSVSSLACLNATLSVPMSLAYNGVSFIDFAKDSARRINDVIYLANPLFRKGVYNSGISNRNNTAFAFENSLTVGIASSLVNAVAMTVLPDAPVDAVTGLQVPTIAVATEGGISVIKQDGIVVNITGQANAQKTIAFDKKNNIVSTGYGWNEMFTTPIPSASINITSTGRRYSFGNTPYIGLSNPTKAIAGKDFKLFGYSNYVSFLLESPKRYAAGLVSSITNTFNTGHLIGDIRRAYLADVDVGSVTGQETITDADLNDASKWTFGDSTVSLSNGQLVFTNATYNVNAAHTKDFVHTVGKLYRLKIVISSMSAGGSVRFNQGGIIATTLSAAGTYFALYSPTNTAYNIIVISLATGMNATIDSISIQEVVADRSYKAQAANIIGTLTKTQVAAASQLVAYSGFSAANYLREPYSADLDFGTGEWSASAWVNVPVTLPVGSFPVVGSNLITNGAFAGVADGTDVTTLSGWGAYGSPTNRDIQGEQLRIVTTASSQGAVINVATVVGKTYEVSATASGLLGVAAIYAVVFGNLSSVTGTITGRFTATNTSTPIFFRTGTDTAGTSYYDNISVREIAPALVADRAHSSGAKINLGITPAGFLTATAFDGTTTRTVTTTAAYNTATWLKARAFYTTDGALGITVNGVEVAVTRGAPLLTLNNSNAVLTIGNSFAGDAPFPGSIALLKLSATVPTAEQSQWMYEQEKQMFRDGAQVTLPDAGSIVDLAYDDATDKWLAVSATNESEWSGLVRTSVTASPAGSYSKISAASGIQLQARTTTNPGVDVTIPSYGLREELVNRSQAAARLSRSLVSFDYAGGFTANTTSGSTSVVSAAGITYPVSYVGARVSGAGIPADTFVAAVSSTTIYLTKAATATASAVQISFNDFILPVGYEAKDVLLAGVSQREGATQAFTRLFDGFKETIRFTTAPSNTAFVQIQATRSIQ